MSERPSGATHVVVLGGGLAGVACAHRLGDEGVRVTLIDRNDYHQFQPLLYQVATSQLPAEDIARPHRVIFRTYPSVDVRTAEVARLDAEHLSVTLAGGETVAGSHLVLAAGGRPEFFGVPGAAEHAFPLYSVADAERLRRHLQRLLAAATVAQTGERMEGVEGAEGVEGVEGVEGAVPADPTEELLDVVVVGGGPTGVEVAGALAELMAALAATGAVPRPGQITLVDRGATVLGAFSDKSHEYAHKRLTHEGAVLRLQTGVKAVHAHGVDLDDGTTLRTRTVVWGGGESAATVVQSSGLPAGRGGRVDVRPDLTVPDHPQVYAVGDVANIPAAGGGSLPQLGSVAQQSGRWAAENILRVLHGQERVPFQYKDKGIMAMIGRNAAVAEVGRHRHQVEGPVAFAAWLGVHAMLLSGAHSRTDAFLSWAWDYFDRDHAAIVEGSSTPRRIAWGDADDDVPTIAVEPGGTPAP